MNWKRTGSATFAWLFVALAVVSARGAEVPVSAAAHADSMVVRNSSTKFFPYAYYTPETQFAVGAGGITTFYTAQDSILRPSKVVLSGYYTSTKQYLVTINPEIYFSKNRYYTGMKFTFGHYVDKFYGIGNDTPDLEAARYVADRYGIEIELEVPPLMFVSDRSGLVYDYQYSDI